MSTLWLTSLILGQFVVAEVPPAPAATPPPQAIHQGAKNISLGFWTTPGPLGRPGGSIGGAYFITDRWAVSLQATVGIDRLSLSVPSLAQTETLTQLSAAVAPAARFYLNPCRPVASYVSLGLVGGYSRTPEVSAVNNSVGTGRVKGDGFLEVAGGFGAEWFVVPAVSLSGELGFVLDVVRANNKKVPAFRTISSLLQANLYW